MERMLRWIDRLNGAAAAVSSVAMVLIVALILAEVVVRSAFGGSTMVADEYSAYCYVLLVFLGLGYTLKADAHIRVKIVLARLGPRGQRVLDGVALGLALGLCGFAIWHSTKMVADVYTLEMVSETPAQTPMWLPQLAVPVGLALFFLQLLAQLLRTLSPAPRA